MIRFKQFTKKKKQPGTIPMPIHFKSVEHYQLAEELEWANKNDNTHLKRRETYQKQLGGLKVDAEQRKAIRSYTRNSKSINKHLMGNGKNSVNSLASKISHLYDVIKNNPLPTKLHTYSALGFDPSEHVDEKSTIHSPAFISSTPDKNSAMMFVNRHKDGRVHIAHFHLEAGDPATHIAEHSESPHEEETLIAAGVRLKHHGYVDHTDGHTTFRVHKLSIVK